MLEIRKILDHFCTYVGCSVVKMCEKMGSRSIFLARMLNFSDYPFINYRVAVKMFIEYFWYSLPLVGMTAVCTGMVLALQGAKSMHGFDSAGMQVELVVFAILRELGPILAGLMMAGRLGASIASALSSMSVTDQIDALHSLSISPLYYLVRPKLLATMCALPLLTLWADVLGVCGGYMTCVLKQGMHGPQYIGYALSVIRWDDIAIGLYKAVVFGFIIVCVACYEGLHASRSALGVGISAQKSVVISSLLILFANYWVTFFYS